MVETSKMSASEVAAEHATESHAPYLKVLGGLGDFNLCGVLLRVDIQELFLDSIAGVAVPGGGQGWMVGWYFMHLKFEGNWVYIMIIPAFILATIIVLALSPDMVLKPETEENPGEEYAALYRALTGRQ